METMEQGNLDKSRDQNSKFFHHFASSSRNKKHIWEIKDETGFIISGQEALKSAATKHFKYFYGAFDHTILLYQVFVARIFSTFRHRGGFHPYG
jgi:hypothetical protein